MSIYTGSAIRQVNSYHQNISLLYQFILAEFIESFMEMKKLHVLCSGPIKYVESESSVTYIEQNMTDIKSSLIKLVGSPRDSMRIFPWNFSEGLLSKLKSYCALFLQNTESDGKELIAMQHYIDKVCQACIQSMDLANEAPCDKQSFAAAVEKAMAAMVRFSKLIMRLLQQFRDDENVIFFIVRNHKIIDRLYGSRYVHKIMGRLYGKGMREAHHLLTKRYNERGFDTILRTIDKHITDIEAAAL